MKKRENLFRPYWGKRHIFIIVIAILVLASAAFCTAKTFLPAFTPLWVALIVAAIVVIVTSFLNMKKQVNLSGLRWSVKELLTVFYGMIVGIYIVWYLSTVLTYPAFLSTAAIIITGIAGIIAALSLKRTIDTVRPFLTLIKTELLLDEPLHEGVMRLNIRNAGPTPAEKISIELSLSKLESDTTNRELYFHTFESPTIFPTEERVITYYPRPELLKLIEAEKAKITINIIYYSAQKKYYTTRTMNILKGKALDKGRFPFNFIDSEDSWD